MYGLIGRFTAVHGKREELVAILTGSTTAMPGCLSYVIALDLENPDGLWITEVWDSADSHKASLSLPEVQVAIKQAMPLIAKFDSHVETTPVGGVGLHTS